MQVCFLHTLFLEYPTETRGNKCKAVFYRYKRIGMRSLELFWPFSILAKNLGDVLAHSLSYVVYDRFLFNSATQSSEEGIDEFVNQMRKMASSCKYGALTDEMIQDRIVIVIQDKATKLQLLKEEELHLNKALSVCRSNEAASKQLNFMKQGEIQTDEQVNVMDRQTK